MKLATKTLLACTTAALLGSSAYAAIVVEDSYTQGNAVSGTVDGVAFTYTVSAAELGLTAATADKLVIGFSQRRNDNFTVSYGGVGMVQTDAYLVSGGNNDGSAGIFYLDSFTLGSDLVITATSGVKDFSGRSLFAYVLSGTADGGPVDFDTSTKTDKAANSVSVTTGSEGGFVIGAMGINGSGTSGTSLSGTPIASNSGNTSLAAAWNDAVSGTYTMTFNNNNDSTGAIAAFAPVPEPGSLALMGLGGLLIARRRRGA